MQLIKISIFKAKDGWRWHMKRSGRIIAESGEGYTEYRGAKRTLTNLINTLQKEGYAIEDAPGKK